MLNWKSLTEQQRTDCLRRPAVSDNAAIHAAVRDIIARVRREGDVAIRQYTKQFDKAEVEDLRALRPAANLDPSICRAIDAAHANIAAFHSQQGFRPYDIETAPGVLCRRVIRPIGRVGLYVPGGSAPLVSTTLMLGVPARIAGCVNITLCTPCNPSGEINPYILYAARLCGIENVFRIGGAQAIAAMAYGTQTIPKVDKIFGPGNAYVTEAKLQVSRDPDGAAMDMPAGPSEVCVIADETTDPVFAASDLLSQAEHDTHAQVLLIVTSEEKCSAIRQEMKRQLQTLSRRAIAQAALDNSLAIVAEGVEDALRISNAYAPEHLILSFEGAEKYLDHITNAGSVFVGPWTPEAAGDYISGTNHVLPTYGYANAYSGLTVEVFQKTMTVQHISQEGINGLAPDIETLSGLEGLDAHGRAATLRTLKGI